MTDDGSEPSTTAWPLPKFVFQVSWGDEVLTFQEVAGLDVEARPLEYRHGDSPEFSTIKMPGLNKHGNVTLKRGVARSDRNLRVWLSQIRMNTISRRPVTISLLDESGAPTMVWTLANARPIRISATDLQSDGNEVAIESLEIVHEGVTIATA